MRTLVQGEGGLSQSVSKACKGGGGVENPSVKSPSVCASVCSHLEGVSIPAEISKSTEPISMKLCIRVA